MTCVRSRSKGVGEVARDLLYSGVAVGAQAEECVALDDDFGAGAGEVHANVGMFPPK
ncbi:MAG: hypothetical protein JWM76_2852 [Pseudonocardiales bacterium]|nr:hypothetical protein [Pseudonocardiales bacterium]